MHGPPAYYTMDWGAAERSVRLLAALEPNVVVSGHGKAMRGEHVASELSELSRHFTTDAVPRRGRYVRQPARADRTGVVFVPPPVPDVVGRAVAGVAAAAVAAFAFAAIRRRGGGA